MTGRVRGLQCRWVANAAITFEGGRSSHGVSLASRRPCSGAATTPMEPASAPCVLASA
jgi:hypothetical protein